MNETILACDLGTGGNKASLYDREGNCLASTFVPYQTLYPRAGWHEQRPADWWDAVVRSTRLLGEQCSLAGVRCVSLSGHSLGAVPLDKSGNLLRETTPIWSDTRALKQVERFTQKVPETAWYLKTGNGFPPACYTLFKVMWYRDEEPELFGRISRVIGTKDYLNYLMTGELCTDYSYASGSGVYDLKGWSYDQDLLKASGLDPELFPGIVPSSQIIGGLTPEAAERLGLEPGTPVAAGGVDNSCMAVGAGNIEEGRVYTSLGSSSWIALSSEKPVLHQEKRPFVFTHVIPGMFTSAVSIFAAGSALNWVRSNVCRNLELEAEKSGRNVYELMGELAAESPAGARGVLFNPSLAGGGSQEESPHIRGGFLGLDLVHNQADLVRAAFEGIAMNLSLALDVLKEVSEISHTMVMVGGGSRSGQWRQIFADCYGMDILRTGVDQDAGALGAAAVGAVACGLWEDFRPVDRVRPDEERTRPDPDNMRVYASLREVFDKSRHCLARLGNMMHTLEQNNG
jgi:xylulokinase